MRTVNIDGLPGLTMQGVKGSLGERGGSMFYNAGSSFAYSSKFLKAMAISEDDIDKEKFSESDIKCIPCDGIVPIINDYFFNIENNYTSLYVIKDIIYFSISSYDAEGVVIHDEQTDTYDIATYSNLLKKLPGIIGNYLKIYNSSKNFSIITKTDAEVLTKYPVFIIKYLDTWEYLDANPSSSDLAVTVLSSSIPITNWNGEYKIKKQKCSGHRFDIINLVYDYGYTMEVAEKHASDKQSGIFSFRILDASTYLPIVDNRTAQFTIYKNADELSWQNILLFEQTASYYHNIVSGPIDYTEDGAVHTISIGDEECNRAYMKLDINGYFTTRVFLTGATDYTIYVFKYVLSDEVANADFELVHDYDYIDSSKADDEINPDDPYTYINVTKFYVNSSMSKEEKAKFKIEAEFTSSEKKKYVMSTMRDTLWKGEIEELYEDEDSPESHEHYSKRHGRYANFTNKLNFDNENPGDFSIVIKDYTEGNDVKMFSSSAIIPQFLEEDYEMTIYAYYKATSDNCTKIYLGKGTFGDTIA